MHAGIWQRLPEAVACFPAPGPGLPAPGKPLFRNYQSENGLGRVFPSPFAPPGEPFGALPQFFLPILGAAQIYLVEAGRSREGTPLLWENQ